MLARLIVRPVRYKGRHGQLGIRDRSMEAQIKKQKKKILDYSLETAPMSANLGRRKKFVEKDNRFGLKVSTTKVIDHAFDIDPKWKDLKGPKRHHVADIMKAAEKEVIINKKRQWKFSGEVVTGGSIFKQGNISLNEPNRPLVEDSKTESKIIEELNAVRPIIDRLLEKTPKNMTIPIDEFQIVGLEKRGRTLILVRISSDQDKKRKEEILDLLQKHRNYFDKPVSDAVTTRTIGRKHRVAVRFSWIPKDHGILSQTSLLAEGYTKADHDEGLIFI